MPRGRSPTLINLIALRFATSITSTAAPSSALTYSHLPSGLNTTCSGFCPLTLTLVSSRGAAARIRETLLFSSTATAIHAPSRENQQAESSKFHGESEADGRSRNCSAIRYHPAASNIYERRETSIARRGGGAARVGLEGGGAVRGSLAPLAHARHRALLGAFRRAHPCAGPDGGGDRRDRLSPRHRLAQLEARVAYPDRGAGLARLFERVRLALPVQLHRDHPVPPRRRRAAAEPRVAGVRAHARIHAHRSPRPGARSGGRAAADLRPLSRSAAPFHAVLSERVSKSARAQLDDRR